jgi:hypothetical protein
LTNTTAADASAVPGVTAAVPVKHTFVHDRTDTQVLQHAAWYLDGPHAFHVMRQLIDSGSLTTLTGETVALSSSIAEAHGWSVGSTARLWLSNGAPTHLQVVAILDEQLGMPAICCHGHWRLIIRPHIYLMSSTSQWRQASTLQSWRQTLQGSAYSPCPRSSISPHWMPSSTG